MVPMGFIPGVVCHVNAGKYLFLVCFCLTIVAAVAWTRSRLSDLARLLRRASRAREIKVWQLIFRVGFLV
jgi:hypothetical protein